MYWQHAAVHCWQAAVRWRWLVTTALGLEWGDGRKQIAFGACARGTLSMGSGACLAVLVLRVLG